MTSVVEREGVRSARVAPHSIEAEESVLGAVMISAEAADVALERLHPDDFYKPAHQLVFAAVAELFDANEPIDAVTVTEGLRRSSALDRVGGIGFITALSDAVPTASNIDHYAGIVEEHALRRRLLRAGGDIGTLATSVDQPIAEVLDSAEQTVFGVSDRRVGDGLAPIDPLLFPAIEKAEELSQRGSEVTGVPTGFRDLDRKLAGLHPTNLLIVAARPGMGKCLVGGTRIVDPKSGGLVTVGQMVSDRTWHGTHHVAALDEATLRFETAAPVDYHDNGVRETFTLTTRLGRSITATSNHPLLTTGGWRPLAELVPGDEIAVPGRLDVFGVDTMEDAEVALLGYLLGDGCLLNATPRLTTGSERIAEDARAWAVDLGLDMRRSPRPGFPTAGSSGTAGETTYSFVAAVKVTQGDIARHLDIAEATVCRALQDDPTIAEAMRRRVQTTADEMGYRGHTNPLTALLAKHGVMGWGSAEKTIPEAVFRLPKRQVALFLSRLYAADGSAWVHGNIYRIEYCSVSEELARGVQHLLLRFGVVAMLRRRSIRYRGEPRTAWEVSFQDPESVERFADEIGIFSKEAALAEVVDIASHRTRTQSTTSLLPMSTWDVVLEEKGDRSWADVSEACGRPRNHDWHVNRRRPSRQLLATLATALDSERLRTLASSDVVWDPVVSVVPAGRRRTYDITVPVHHNFVADDVVVHNSALALTIAKNVAVEDNPVAIFSLEMSREEVVTRLLCSQGRIDSQRLRTGRLTEGDFTRLSNAASVFYRKPVYVDDSPGLTVTEIRAKCRRLKRRPGLSLVIVDYLQLMHSPGNQENRQQEIATISRNLKNLARELHVPVIAVSQLNRSLESREDKRPRLGDLRESGAIEQDSDVVMFIYRHEYYHPEATDTKGLAEVHIAKHRQGAVGKVDMTFLPEFTLFADLGRDAAVAL